jgi:lipopolysaccharide/colanic/teichoic acid biosynthesis glycosyltransferase
LPQLLNVLVGQMSLVGPRPEVPKYVAMYNDEQREVLKCKPGLTDPASLQYINETELLATFENPEQGYIQQIMPDKLRMNLEYLRHRTWASDMRVLVKTVVRLFQA